MKDLGELGCADRLLYSAWYQVPGEEIWMHVATIVERVREVGIRSQEEERAVEIIITIHMDKKTLSCHPRKNSDILQMPIIDRGLYEVNSKADCPQDWPPLL